MDSLNHAERHNAYAFLRALYKCPNDSLINWHKWAEQPEAKNLIYVLKTCEFIEQKENLNFGITEKGIIELFAKYL